MNTFRLLQDDSSQNGRRVNDMTAAKKDVEQRRGLDDGRTDSAERAELKLNRTPPVTLKSNALDTWLEDDIFERGRLSSEGGICGFRVQESKPARLSESFVSATFGT